MITYFSRIAVHIFVAMLMLLTLNSCGSVIFQDEGDCDVTYRLRFRYDMNMKFADAFSHEVKSVRLYAFNSEGNLVWQMEESGEILAKDGYEILLPLPAGDYKFIAWCGIDNGESFTVQEITKGDPREPLHCKLNRTRHEEEGAVSTDDLHPLFYGVLEANLPEDIDGGDHLYVMPLIKDTNVIRIVLQHLSGQDINADDFSFKIEDNNGWLQYDNSLRNDEIINYHAWSKYSGSAGVETRDADLSDNCFDRGIAFASHLAAGAEMSMIDNTRAITDVKVAVAELTVSRLVQRDWSSNSKPMMTIRTVKDNSVVARIPIIDYALLVKGNYNRDMSDQEYLDRQDEYNMTFFLDEHNQWLATTVIINSWKVVLNPNDMDWSY